MMRFVNEVTFRAMATVFDIKFSEMTSEGLMEALYERILTRKPCYVVTPNLQFARLVYRDAEFRSALEAADVRLCDSTILFWMLAAKGQRVPEKLTGSDLTPKLLKAAESENLRVFLFGSAPSTLEKVAAKFPTAVCGMISPPVHDRPWELTELNESYLQEMRAARPDILLIALGAKKAECWAHRYFVESGIPVTLCIGGSLDFLAGQVRRSPRLLSRMGLEWLWRLIVEPKRLWQRYWRDGLFLLRHGIFELRKPRPEA